MWVPWKTSAWTTGCWLFERGKRVFLGKSAHTNWHTSDLENKSCVQVTLLAYYAMSISTSSLRSEGSLLIRRRPICRQAHCTRLIRLISKWWPMAFNRTIELEIEKVKEKSLWMNVFTNDQMSVWIHSRSTMMRQRRWQKRSGRIEWNRDIDIKTNRLNIEKKRQKWNVICLRMIMNSR